MCESVCLSSKSEPGQLGLKWGRGGLLLLLITEQDKSVGSVSLSTYVSND